MRSSIRIAASCAAVAFGCAVAIAEPVTIKSPDGKIAVTVSDGAQLGYSVKVRGNVLVAPSRLGIVVDGKNLGDRTKLGRAKSSEVNERYATRGVHTNAVNHYVSAAFPVTSEGGATWQLEVRAYDDAVAYRYHFPGSGTRHVSGDTSQWNLPVGTVIWHQSADNRSYEARYNPDIVGQMPSGLKLMAPATVKFPGDAGYGMMTEANLLSYSDMALKVSGDSAFDAIFQDDPQGWDAEGEIVSPWRVTLFARDLNALVNNDVVRSLCPPPSDALAHAAWIKPGRSIWHWLTGGAPKLDEQKAWIDGTRKIGYEYYLVDDGWRKWNGGGDNAWKALEEIVTYARGQGVAIWAWVDSKYVFEPADRAAYFKRARSIGVVGLKIDFPKPAGARWVQWYDDTLRDAAAAELMVDFHGAVKPTGRERTWPNEMTREAISGREQGKNPGSHDTALPFIRFVQGHADYTPTLLISNRLSGSTFPHELAMAIVFTSPYLCMGDHPDRYLASDAADVFKALPATWDETIVLPGSEIGQMAGFARRSGKSWFIGVINGSMPRRQEISLEFLGKGKFHVVALADDRDRINAFARSNGTVTSGSKLIVPLRRDGGYVAWITPEERK